MDRILELGLNRLRKSDCEDAAVQSVWLIDQMLELIAENLGDNNEDTPFRSQLEQLRQQILSSDGAPISCDIASQTLNACRDEFKRVQAERTRRDEHFAEIIIFLRKALASLTGDSKTYHDNLLETSERIRGLIELKDIEYLKQRVAAEVSALNKIVSEKQQREQVQFAHLSEQVSVLQRKLEVAKAEASLDGVTGIANRRNFDFTIQRWVTAHEQNEEPFTVAIIDIDNFKQINDGYGHQIGDQVLISAALALGKSIRGSDFLARYGGDEFVILAEGMKIADCEKRFGRLLEAIRSQPFECRSLDGESSFVSLTVSCGVAEYALGESAKDLIRRADEALYNAKRDGRDRVVSKRRPLLGAFYEGRKRSAL